jgi:hypothetical protein
VHWAIQCRDQLPAAWIVAIRLGEDNNAVLDYVLLPIDGQAGRLIKILRTSPCPTRNRSFRNSCRAGSID